MCCHYILTPPPLVFSTNVCFRHVMRVLKTNYSIATAVAPTAEFGRLETFFVYSSGYVPPTGTQSLL